MAYFLTCSTSVLHVVLLTEFYTLEIAFWKIPHVCSLRVWFLMPFNVFVLNFSVKSGAFFWSLSYLVFILEQAIMDTSWFTIVPCYCASFVPFTSTLGKASKHRISCIVIHTRKQKTMMNKPQGSLCKFSLEIESQFQSFIVWCLHILHVKWAKNCLCLVLYSQLS